MINPETPFLKSTAFIFSGISVILSGYKKPRREDRPRRITQANVIRRLTGKRSKKTIIQHWKTLFPKKSSEETIFDWRDLANQKPLHQWSNSELGIPTLEQERNYYPDKNINLLIYHLQCMRQLRIQELERVGRY